MKSHKENSSSRHSHKPSLLPQGPTIVCRKILPEKNRVLPPLPNNDEPECENDANISFQMTAPKIIFPSQQNFVIKRSYLDKVEVPQIFVEKDQNVCEEYAASPTSQIGPCSRRCTLVANNENVDFYMKQHTAQNSGISYII